MGVFDDVLKGNESLIKNEEPLDYDFLPKLLPYRESEQKYLATCIKPLFYDRPGKHLFIHGAPGIGKTAATKHVLRDLEEETDRIESIYINCWRNNTTYKVLMEICDQIGYKFTQNKKTTDLYKVVSTLVNKKSAVFVFDEIDKAEDLDFLYFILQDIHKKSVFLITNFKSWISELDNRIKSRLTAEMVEFKEYNLQETKGILEERKTHAFYENVWDEEAFGLIVNKTAKLKDVRSGLFLLKESAFEAENLAKKSITKEHVSKAIQKLDDFTTKDTAELDQDSALVFELVKKNSGKKIGELYASYQEKGGVGSYKTFQRKIAKLEDGNFISTTKKTGSGGNTTIVEKKLSEF